MLLDNPLLGVGIVLAALGLAYLGFVLLPKLLVSGMRDALEARVKQRFPEQGALLKSELAASSFGAQSLGVAGWKSSGALVVTGQELRFFQLFPRREFRIFHEHITGLKLVRSHLGQATAMQLLRVEFQGRRGLDAMAFWVPDPGAWQAQLEALRPPKTGDG
jgi:hypothetical protein